MINIKGGLDGIILNENTFNYRFGGKLSLLSLQKGDPFWTSLRTSVGRNQGDNQQGYSFSELINTFKLYLYSCILIVNRV